MARTQVADATVAVRLLESIDELEAAVAVITGVWGEAAATLASPVLLRTYSHYGNPVIGAFDGGRLCGVSIGFLAPEPEVHLHSHITGVLPSHQHLGVGFALKNTQRRWCLEHDVSLVTWTFDPMLARNAHFNMRKLGGTARRLFPAFYGDMDDDINRGEQTDRLEVRWELTAPSLDRAIVRTIAVPDDYVALRVTDPAGAVERRDEVRRQLLAAFDDGLEVVDFARGEGYLLAAGR